MARLIASWFGTGLILGRFRGADGGSGTVGSVFALALSLLLRPIGVWAQAIGALVVLALAIWSVNRVVADEGDAGWIVVDEAAGTMVATIGLALVPALIGFAVFRIADIFKRWFPGVAMADSRHGAAGVIGDDLVAGLYGLAAGALTMWLF